MPTSYELDPTHRLVRSRAWGVLTEEESAALYDELSADPGFRPEFHQVCDMRDLERLEMSTGAVQAMAKCNLFSPAARRAFVAAEDAHYGMARMLQALFEVEGKTIGVFRTMAEAEAWLAGPEGT